MFGDEHRCTLMKHGKRHSCRIDEVVQLQAHHRHVNGMINSAGYLLMGLQ